MSEDKSATDTEVAVHAGRPGASLHNGVFLICFEYSASSVLTKEEH